ncbi:MAG: Flp family type IVb pilin [Acidobacteriia bacterium]|nr:Flp family type IVb pilin [Terriglobia bacterium]
MTSIRRFWLEEEGQDLIEYTLLLAFVALVAAAVFIGAGQSASGIWTIVGSHLANVSTAAS